ncbi:hypothetical protein BH23CHL2_BH23CHL2_20900 [soil metagenome]
MLRSTHRSRDAHALGGPLFGREREQATLRACLENAIEGCGSLVLVGGEAGVGKTSLVQSFARVAEAEDIQVLISACYDLSVTPPYGPWLKPFSSLGTEQSRPPLPVDVDHSETHRAESQDALFAEAYEYLAGVVAQQPLVIILEDLHWADAASLAFLRYLARQLEDLPLLLIITYRDTELDRDHALHQLLPFLVREARATRVHLRPLDEDAIKALVSDYYGGKLSTADELRIVRYLKERAEGNPFFIGEILRTLEEKGYISQTNGDWEVADLGQIPVPSLIQQVIEGRLARIDRKSLKLLEVASVIGQDVSLNVWQAASSASDDDLSAAIRQATDLHLLEEAADPAPLRFTHALVREALYFELDLPERRLLHRNVGEALAAQSWPEPEAVAHHFREARHEQAPEWLMAAGERAQKLYAWRMAAELFESILSFLGVDPSYAEIRGWLLYRIGLLLTYADPDRGIEHLGESERIARDINDEHLAAYARADRGLLRCLTGDVRRGLDEMREGVAALDALPSIDHNQRDVAGDSRLTVESIRRGAFDLIGASAEKNIRRGALIFWLAWSGRFEDTIAIGKPYVAQAPDTGATMQDALGDALAGLGHAYAYLGQPDEALGSFARARDTYASIDHHFKEGNTAIYELSEAYLPFRADRILGRQWLADQAEAG